MTAGFLALAIPNILMEVNGNPSIDAMGVVPVSYTHLRAHETVLDLVCRLLLEKTKNNSTQPHFLRAKSLTYTRHLAQSVHSTMKN